jgi:Tfp pilus assembly protein PilV
MRARSAQRGVSLIEALVALAVMAFGILGVVGIQSALRGNADISRQRSEAVRLAQEAIENARAFDALTTTPGRVAYADIVNAAETIAGLAATNTTYTRTQTVVAAAAGRAKVLAVDVSWPDRTGQVQSVRLTTTIAGVTPEVAGSLGLPGDDAMTRRVGGRNAAIPVTATDNGTGTSNFAPPGAPTGTVWVFNNTNGIITEICNPACTPANALLLQGFVRFATGAAQPTPADAENPTGSAFPLDVAVATTVPTSATVACFEQAFPAYVAYLCALPVATAAPALGNWSGTSFVDHPSVATTATDVSASHYRVCRYTSATTETTTPPTPNADHPRNYTLVGRPLLNQNFLLIRAGNGTTTFTCPADGPGPTNTNTLLHQPAP